jgi:hypothetical protein
MMPYDYSTNGPIKNNKTSNPFGEMIGQLIRQVILLKDPHFLILFIQVFILQKEVDVSLCPFVVRLERQDIGIGGLIGGLVNGMLIRYPSFTEKSIYATIEPFQYQVINF